MSEQLLQIFMGNTPVYLDETAAEGEPKLTWKVVLRTGTWKLRPGPGGVKLEAPLKILRDKAPKGHISMTALKANFEAGAKEHVTVPQVHIDGTTSDGGFVRKLAIQDIKDDKGKVTESLLWAGMEITDSDLKKKIDEKSIVGVSGGILFDYQRTEDAKKFDQILSHVMATNSPWINGTGGFHDKLPAEVMASEPEDLPIGEFEFTSRETEEPEHEPNLPSVKLDDPPEAKPSGEPKSGTVVWRPEQGFRRTQDKVQKALREWRDALMANVPIDQRYSLDWPYFHVEDVSLDAERKGTALISSGYGSEADSWVAGFKYDVEDEIELSPFASWTVAKQEWVAASEQPPPPARPAGRQSTGTRPSSPPRTNPSNLTGLQEAQAKRAERMGLGTNPTTTGGSMGRLTDLLQGVELSDEQREAFLAEETRLSKFEQDETARLEQTRQADVTAYCGSADGQTKGKLDELGLGDPGVKKYVRNALLSDDGGPAIELSEHLDGGQKTQGVPKTATELLKGFIDILPKADDGRVSLADQARRIPGDPKPPETEEKKKEDPNANADALLADFASMGLGAELGIPATKEA